MLDDHDTTLQTFSAAFGLLLGSFVFVALAFCL
jgi:hypothetical protein